MSEPAARSDSAGICQELEAGHEIEGIAIGHTPRLARRTPAH